MMYRFAAGGLENVVVQLINRLPREQFRHSIIALTQVDSEFVRRIARDDVGIIELCKPPGQPFPLYPSMFKLLRHLEPDVLHTCNIAALEFMPVAFLAGVPLRIHAEHGWDMADPNGSNWRYRLLRRLYSPFVHDFVAVSVQLQEYLQTKIGVDERRIHLVPNGVDTQVFRPRKALDEPPADFPFRRPDHWVLGTVGRLEPIKNQILLVEAFIRMVRAGYAGAERLRLAVVGGGPLAESIRQKLTDAGLAGRCWLPGARSDIPAVLRSFDCFVLPSLAEGTSCTLQEAMASGLPIVATDVGGNSVLLEQGRCGKLVRSNDPECLAEAILEVFAGSPLHVTNEAAALSSAREKHGLDGMVKRYQQLFWRV